MTLAAAGAFKIAETAMAIALHVTDRTPRFWPEMKPRNAHERLIGGTVASFPGHALSRETF